MARDFFWVMPPAGYDEIIDLAPLTAVTSLAHLTSIGHVDGKHGDAFVAPVGVSRRLQPLDPAADEGHVCTKPVKVRSSQYHSGIPPANRARHPEIPGLQVSLKAWGNSGSPTPQCAASTSFSAK